MTVLVVDDDPAIRKLLRTYLPSEQYRIIEAGTAAEAIEMVAAKRPDIVLLDLLLPDADGTEVIRTVRGWSAVPIIVLSGRGQERAKVECLEAGADDYVTKPFALGELLARIRANLRRVSTEGIGSSVFEAGPLKMDLAARRIWLEDQEIHLTPLEYRLLTTLARHAGKVVTHRQLLTEVWGEEYSEDAQYLRVYMGYLRKKLEPLPDSVKILLTEHRVGYRLVSEGLTESLR